MFQCLSILSRRQSALAPTASPVGAHEAAQIQRARAELQPRRSQRGAVVFALVVAMARSTEGGDAWEGDGRIGRDARAGSFYRAAAAAVVREAYFGLADRRAEVRDGARSPYCSIPARVDAT